MGLAMVRQIAAVPHGGTLTVSSLVRRGDNIHAVASARRTDTMSAGQVHVVDDATRRSRR